MKIQVEEDPTVESLFIKEVDKPLIVGIILKNQVICKEYTYIGLGIYTVVETCCKRCALCRVTNDKSTVVDRLSSFETLSPNHRLAGIV